MRRVFETIPDQEILSQDMLWKTKEALVASFKSIQDKFSKYAMQHSIYSGSTACVALISKINIYLPMWVIVGCC